MRVRVIRMYWVVLLLFIFVPAAFAARHRAAPTSPVQEYEGTIKTAAADSIVVTTSHKEDVTFSIVDSTVVRKGQTTVDPSTLVAGDRVHVKATTANDVNTAVLVIVQDTESSDDPSGDDAPNVVTANGYVASVASDSIVVHRANGTDATVKVTDGTLIKKHGQTIHLADIKVGDHVECLGTAVDPTTIAAMQIEVEDGNPSEERPANVKGTVTAVGTDQLSLGSVVVKTDSNTRIRKQGRAISLSDVQVGDFVQAEGTRVDATTILASEIQVSGGGGHH